MPLRDRVETWLQQDGFDPEVADDVPEGTMWRLAADYPIGFPVRIRVEQREGVGERVDIVVNLRVSDAHRAAMAEAPESDREEFLHRLSVELLRGDPGFALAINEDDESSGPQLAGVQLKDYLYEEDIRRGPLMRAIRDVYRLASLVSILLTNTFLVQR